MRELKPCPFCGGKPELLETMCIEPDWWSAGVFCSHGHTSIQMLADGRTADEAYERVVAGWNRRAEWLRELTTLKDENEKLRESLVEAEHSESMAWDRACKAEAENAKLWELCVKALEWLRWVGGEVPDEFADAIRELGVEADG